MRGRREFLKFAGAAGLAFPTPPAPLAAEEVHQQRPIPYTFDVKQYGATGNGSTIDSPAINRAIEAASSNGGGTVYFPAGNYLCYSIRLKSNVALQLDQGAVIVAADAHSEGQAGGYDDPEPPQPWEAYQDFGHNHWHNTLIWGDGLHDVSIFGPGRVWGRGLVHDDQLRHTDGIGNKSISLKNCHNVILRDFQILQGGWFGILATGVDSLVIDSVTIDTNRDGMDIDCCRNVRISNCSVNSPWDDAIVLKSSYALGYPRPTENVAITNCYVTGKYELGTMLDGTWKEFPRNAANVWQTGRIKFGTESNGGFRNITISNCVFEGCQGLALETVDGAVLEDVTITNISMRDVVSAPIFLRLGSRLRGPAGSKTGALRRVLLSNIVCSDADARLGCIISGVPGYPIEDLKLHDIYIQHRGGGTRAQAAIIPPENEQQYPEPNMFGTMPSQGFFLRHCKNIELSDIEIAAIHSDARPAFVLQDVDGADFFHVKAPPETKMFELRKCRDVNARWVRGVRDGQVARDQT